MRRLGLAIVLACGMGSLAGAGEPPGPVCAQPDVLRRLADTLRQAGRPLILEAATVGEVSTAAGLVHCAVRTHAPAYDTNRFGYRSLDRAGLVQYTLELRRNGIFLSLD